MKVNHNISYSSKAILFLFLLILSVTFLIPITFLTSSAFAMQKWQANYDKSLKLFKSKKYDSALKFALTGVKENKNPYTLELTGNILQLLKKFKSSSRYFKKSIAAAVSGSTKTGSKEQIIVKNKMKFIKMVKNNIGLNYLLTGNMLLRKAKTKAAIKSYKEGMTYADEKRLSDILMLSSALAYENLGKFNNAVNYAKKVTDNDPKSAFAYFIKGRGEYDLKEIDASIKDLKKALKLKPENKLFKKSLKTAELTEKSIKR